MSNQKVRAAIEQMEAWTADPLWEPDPDELSKWNAVFQEAVAQASKGDGWPDLVARAHAVGRHLETQTARLSQLRNAIGAELDVQERGHRALKSYGASTR
jgi:hypothetical protein